MDKATLALIATEDNAAAIIALRKQIESISAAIKEIEDLIKN